MSTTPDATHLAFKNTKELSATFEAPTSFKLLYFPIHSNGATSREILTIAGAKWENLEPKDWEKEKEKTPFNVLPVLFITSPTHKDVVLAEAGVIEQYLAKQFGFMGDNEYEENLIKSFHSSTTALFQLHSSAVAFIPDYNARKKAMDAFREGPFMTWVATHEKHLRDNGSNGHYIGDKLTLADIRMSNLYAHFALQTDGQALCDIIDRTIPLRNVRTDVAFNHKVGLWRATAQYRAMTEATARYFSNPVPVTTPAPKL
ncbi:hypothetical protein BGX29_004458 [Mortierella sp. GBA35]|nr:hypothetical protein BGX29_004458 [Mortierella sp. GBA35]